MYPAPLEIMNDLTFSLIAMSGLAKRNEIAVPYNCFFFRSGKDTVISLFTF